MRNEINKRPNWLSSDQNEAYDLLPFDHKRLPATYWLLRVSGVLAALMLIGLHLMILAGPTTGAERPDLIVPMWRRLADTSVAGVIGIAAVVPHRWAGTSIVFVIRVVLLTGSGIWFATQWWGSLRRGSAGPLAMYFGIVALGFLAAAGTALWWHYVRCPVPDSELPN